MVIYPVKRWENSKLWYSAICWVGYVDVLGDMPQACRSFGTSRKPLGYSDYRLRLICISPEEDGAIASPLALDPSEGRL